MFCFAIKIHTTFVNSGFKLLLRFYIQVVRNDIHIFYFAFCLLKYLQTTVANIQTVENTGEYY